MRSFIHSVNGFKKVHIIEREKNYGLARSIIDGVTTQVNAYGRTIVLEDDLVTAPYFLQFMNSALEMYKDEPRIGHIQACDFTQDHRYRILFLLNGPEAGAGQPGIALGNISNPDGKALLNELEKRKLTYTFDFNGKYGYTRMLRRQTEAKIIHGLFAGMHLYF